MAQKTNKTTTLHKNQAKILRDKKTGRIKKGISQKTNKNGTAGAPTKYQDKFCEQIIKFFDIEKNRREVIAEKTTPSKWGEAHERKYKYIANDLPTFQAFARKIKVDYRTLYEWAHAKVQICENKTTDELLHPEFSQAYNICKDLQKEFLIDNGLKGLYPPASFIFVAKNVTDMKDATELNVKKANNEEVDDDELKAAIFS